MRILRIVHHLMQYKRIRSSYRVKTTRDALLSGLSDPLGTYIEDYEYVEGLGDLDRYNGRFCVTPEYPNGVYCYFTTITGTTGNPAYPYFIGSEFYGEADAVNGMVMDYRKTLQKTQYVTEHHL